MSGDLVSLRMVLVGAAPPHQDLWREGAAQASVPIDFESGNAAAAKAALSKGGVDICVLDAELDDAGKASVIKAARAKRPAPLVFVSAPNGSARPAKTDGLLPVPATAGDAGKLVEICIRAKMPTQVLIVEGSESLRSIVRKILAASRFELDVHEAADSTDALTQLRNSSYGIVFLDYNMPGLNGADILLGIKRERPDIAIVMMTSSLKRGASGRPHLSGALGFLKKPFYPADVDAILERYFGLQRAGLTRHDVLKKEVRRRKVLLPAQFEREFAVANARGEAFGEGGRGVFAIGRDKLGEGGEQAGLRQAIAVNAVEARFRPSLLQIAQGHALLLVVGHRLARVYGSLRYRHFVLRPRRVQIGRQVPIPKDVSTRTQPSKPADRGKVNNGAAT